MSEYAVMPLQDYVGLCGAIRSALGIEGKITSGSIGAYIGNCYDAGANAQDQMFWDEFQQNGNKTNYRYAFFQWTDFNYNPKYPIKLNSQATDVFYYGKITDTKVDISATTSLVRCFSQCTSLVTIRKLSVIESVTFSADCFAKCTALENVTFEGVIGNNISFAESPLSVASMNNIISCLKDYSSASGTHTVTFRADRDTMLTAAEKKVATDKGWTLVWA